MINVRAATEEEKFEAGFFEGGRMLQGREQAWTIEANGSKLTFTGPFICSGKVNVQSWPGKRGE